MRSKHESFIFSTYVGVHLTSFLIQRFHFQVSVRVGCSHTATMSARNCVLIRLILLSLYIKGNVFFEREHSASSGKSQNYLLCAKHMEEVGVDGGCTKPQVRFSNVTQTLIEFET